MSKVAYLFSSKVSILMKITSDDPTPTPGYLYGEAVKISNESIEFCEHMVEFLVSRLKRTSFNIKLKTLLVLRNVLDEGSVDFAPCLRKQSNEVKFYTTFSGPADPLLGNALYGSIRKTAAEILDVLIDTDRGTSASLANNSSSPKPPVLLSTHTLEFPTINESMVCILFLQIL